MCSYIVSCSIEATSGGERGVPALFFSPTAMSVKAKQGSDCGKMTSRSYIYVLNASKNILSEMLTLEIHQTAPPNNKMESGNSRWFCKK